MKFGYFRRNFGQPEKLPLDEAWKFLVRRMIVAGNLDSNVFLFVHNDYPSATIDSITPSPATYGDTISFSGSGSDTDGSIIGYEWNSSVDGFLSDQEDFSAILTVATHNISLRVQDD